MGVDIYGCKFTQERKAMHDLMDEIGFQAYFALPQEEKPWDRSKPGAYLSKSYWSWRPIAWLICELFPDIASRCRYWQSNDGDGLNGTYAYALAEELDKALDDGTVADYIECREAGHRAQPPKKCDTCKGTGVRDDEIGIEHDWPFKVIPKDAKDIYGKGPHPRAGETGSCNACKGRGHRFPSSTYYSTTIKEVKQFSEFCRHSGGFEIH